MGNNRSKVPDLEKLVKGGRKKFVRYEEEMCIRDSSHYFHLKLLLRLNIFMLGIETRKKINSQMLEM